MKIYGFTAVDSECCYLLDKGKGPIYVESLTKLYTSPEKRLKNAYKEYKRAYAAYEFEDGMDADGYAEMTEEQFAKECYSSSVVIKGSYSHKEFVFFEQDIEEGDDE